MRRVPVWLSSRGGLFFSEEKIGGEFLGKREGRERAGRTGGRENWSGCVI